MPGASDLLTVLGSPIGATIGYFLLQHKAELGNKYVSGISIIHGDVPDNFKVNFADLIFYIADVLPEKLIPGSPYQDPPQGQPQSTAAPALGELDTRHWLGDKSFTQVDFVEKRMPQEKNVLRVHTVKNY
jgi:hypothetical protein